MRDGAAIYERSFAIIRAEADLSRFTPEEAEVAVRMIHACGLVEAARDVASRRGSSRRGAALRARRADPLRRRDGGARHHPRAAAGRQRGRLHPARSARPELAAELGTTRSAAALELWRERLGGAVVAIGNAPTALFRLLEMLDGGRRGRRRSSACRSASSAPPSRRRRSPRRPACPSSIVRGRLGGSAMAAAAVNALARRRM